MSDQSKDAGQRPLEHEDEEYEEEHEDVAGPSEPRRYDPVEYPFGPPTRSDLPPPESLYKSGAQSMEHILLSEIQALKEKIASLNSQVQKFERDNTRLRKQRDLFQSPLRETSELLLAIQERNAQMEQELNELTEDRDELAEMVETLTDGNRRLFLQIEEDRRIISDAEEMISILRASLEESKRQQEMLSEAQRSNQTDIQTSAELLRLWRRLQETSLDRLNPQRTQNAQSHGEAQKNRDGASNRPARPAFEELLEISNTEIEKILEDASLITTSLTAESAPAAQSPLPSNTQPQNQNESQQQQSVAPVNGEDTSQMAAHLQELVIENAELRRRLNDYSSELMRHTIEKMDEFDKTYQQQQSQDSSQAAGSDNTSPSKKGSRTPKSRKTRRPDGSLQYPNNPYAQQQQHQQQQGDGSGFCVVS